MKKNESCKLHVCTRIPVKLGAEIQSVGCRSEEALKRFAAVVLFVVVTISKDEYTYTQYEPAVHTETAGGSAATIGT